ncbi:MAG: serine/threonine protein kinase, partial [Bradymonadia bacterium]
MSGRPCPVCGTDVPPNNAFCGACGARMPKSASGAGHDQLIGQVIDGRFRILNLLGSGGMGAVYLAEHVGIGKQVAIKVLRADLRDNRDL